MSKFTPFNLTILSILCFLFLGPLKFNISDYTGGLPTLIYEPSTWTQVYKNLTAASFSSYHLWFFIFLLMQTASIIFLDAPVGAGFSYANSSGAWTTTDTLAASQYNDFLRSVGVHV